MRAVQLRQLTEEEWRVLTRIGNSRTAPAVEVRRAQLLQHLAQGASARRAARLVGGVTGETVRLLAQRFNQEGLAALEDRPRPGRKPRLTEEHRGQLVLLAKRPPSADLPEATGACHWTLDTLLEAAHQAGIPVGRTRLWEVLHEEGVRWWERSRSWLESPDPELPEKRGPSWDSTPTRPRGRR